MAKLPGHNILSRSGPVAIQFEASSIDMLRYASLPLNALLVFYLSLSISVSAAADEKPLGNDGSSRRSYSSGELMPVSCLNRTM